MKYSFFNRVLLKLFSRYEMMREQERQSMFRGFALLNPSSIVGAEGSIDNLQYHPDAVQVGANSYIRGRLLVYAHGGKISIGNWCYVGVRSEVWSMESITIGNRVLISHDVNIHDGTAHSSNIQERHEHYRKILTTGHPKTWNEMPGVTSAPIVIEDDVWISFGVTILKGVRIGAGSIIAAGSVVTKDVSPGMLYRNQITPIMTPVS